MKKFILSIIFVGCIFSVANVLAQDNLFDDVHLFQNYFRDTPITLTPYGEAGAAYADYENSTSTFFGLQGGFPVVENLELGAMMGVIYLDPNNRGSETDMSDLLVSARYDITRFLTFMPDKTKTAGGAYVTVPTGSEDVGQDNTNYGVFGALRHPMGNKTILTGTIGMDWLELPNAQGVKDREFSLLLGCGAIYSVSDRIYLVGEFNYQSEGDYMLATGGIDYELKIDKRIRAAIGTGLDDGAPDLTLMLSYAHVF